MCKFRGNTRALLRHVFDLGVEAGRQDILREEREFAENIAKLGPNVVSLEAWRQDRELPYGRRKDDVLNSEMDA